MKRIGKKTKEWFRAKKKLIHKFMEKKINVCEYCGSTWALSFHHLDKRSSGRARHEFKDVRLLCPNCHQKAEYDSEFNLKIKNLR